MLIWRRWDELDDNGILLRDWLLAPLSLNVGTPAYCAHEFLSGPTKSTEIILTTIEPRLWSDLWRLEAETYDDAGTLALICAILHEAKAEILISEGSSNSFSRFHTMSFLISCSRYASSIDGSSETRGRSKHIRLDGLELTLKLNLLSRLNLSTSGFPKLKIRRMETLYRTHKDVDLKQARYVEAMSLPADKRVRISPMTAKVISDNVGQRACYSSMVDTKNRVIRVMVMPMAESHCHLQFLILRDHTFVVREIFAWIFTYDGNVVRYQLRTGANSRVAVDPRKLQPGDRPARLDVTFTGHNQQKAANVRERLVEAVRTVDQLRKAGVEIIEELQIEKGP
jgi:hypothetical protein